MMFKEYLLSCMGENIADKALLRTIVASLSKFQAPGKWYELLMYSISLDR